MVNKNSGLCNFYIKKVYIIQVFLLAFLPILVIYIAFLPAYFEDLLCLNFRAMLITLSHRTAICQLVS